MFNTRFQKVFTTSKPIIGMIHVLPLPATPAYANNNAAIIAHALAEAALYKASGIDALMIENMHDLPYLNAYASPEVIALMSIIAYEVKRATGLPCGIQILAAANKEALAVAKAANLDFIRAEGFVFAHVADEGMMNASAGELLRYRKQIDANDILVFCDIKKKHSSHAITADIDLVETAKAAYFFRSDGVIITGSSTGVAADVNAIQEVQKNTKLPVLVGSGITIDNVSHYLPVADALIVGSYFKRAGYWENEVVGDKVKVFMEVVNKWRGK